VSEILPSKDPGITALGDALRLTFRLLRVVMLLIGIAYLASGVYIVPQHERAFELRFGRPAGVGADIVKGPGLHWSWPRPFTEIVRVPAERMRTLESRLFWAARAGRFQDMPEIDAEEGEFALTGDANLLNHRWAVRYTISDPYRFTFGFVDPEQILRDELNRAALCVSARFSIDRALRTDVAGFRDAVEHELRKRATAFDLGVLVHGVDLLDIAPPSAVAEAFGMVTKAAQERDQLVSDARAYAVRAANEAKAEADRRIAAGAADRQRRASAVAARTAAFAALRDAWTRHPALVEHTLRQDALRETLARAGRKILVPASGSDQELRLNFGAPPRWIEEGRE
jgi:membrane protease subunit HflK